MKLHVRRDMTDDVEFIGCSNGFLCERQQGHEGGLAYAALGEAAHDRHLQKLAYLEDVVERYR